MTASPTAMFCDGRAHVRMWARGVISERPPCATRAPGQVRSPAPSNLAGGVRLGRRVGPRGPCSMLRAFVLFKCGLSSNRMARITSNCLTKRRVLR